MPLKLASGTITFSQKVIVKMPNERGGWNDERFTAKFKLLPVSEVKRLQAEDDFGATLLREVLVDATDVVDADGGTIPFTVELREQLLDVPPIAAALLTAYLKGVNGGAKEKN